MMSIKKRLLLFSLIFLWLLPCVPAGATETSVINIRHWAAPDHTRVVIDATEDPVYSLKRDGRRLLLELDDAAYSKALSRLIHVKKPGIDKIAVTLLDEDRVLIEMFLTEHAEAKVFKLRPVEDKPYRIVVDIVLPEVEKKATEERERVKVTSKKKIVVIDPGHGGDDPGAIGRSGTREKTVVLAISKKIRDVLNKKEGYRAFLTREGDYYVPFRKRLKIAREYQADLFLSIHADAERTRTAAGASVYSLSLRSASSEAARILARNENLADIVGGEANGDTPKEETDPILLNMFQTNTLNASKTLGYMLLHNMGSVNRIKFATVQEAPFMVLKLPEVPSVLVETAYISNRREEKLLRSPKFQKEIAEAIADAAVEYLSQGPGEKTPVTLTKKEESLKPEKEKVSERKASANGGNAVTTPVKQKPVEIVYKVKKGDSLGKIAQKYGTTVSAIAKLNDVKIGKALYVNRKLRIVVPVDEDASPVTKANEAVKKPAASEKTKRKVTAAKGKEKQEEEKAAYQYYTVQKGESLDKIASKNGTTLAVLLKMNQMKIKDPLHAGRKIKIPALADDTAADAKADTKKKKTREQRKAKSAKTYYTVRKGDTLDVIARKHHTTVAALKKMNGTKKLSPLHADQKLVIPGRP